MKIYGRLGNASAYAIRDFLYRCDVPFIGMVRDEAGYIVTGPDLMRDGARPPGWPLDREPYFLETSIPGVFAAGDVRHGAVRRCASAVGEGAMAVAFVHRMLEGT